MMQRLDDAFEAERQFASDASHELRTPMAVIMAQCEDALSGEKTGADYREALSVIHRQGRRMNRMISGMLELVRMAVEKGRATNPDMHFGVCGEHGGDPKSIKGLFNVADVDYVSCSPYRVPLARLAAAQAKLEAKRSA